VANRRATARKSTPTGPRVAPPEAPAVASSIDNVIHERTRLGIVSALAASERLSFTQLREMLGATDGNLSAHARKLEDAGYITALKRFEGRLPRTEYELTPAGREALRRYVAHMEALIQAMRRH